MSSRPKRKHLSKQKLQEIASIAGLSVDEVERLWQQQHVRRKRTPPL